MPTEPNAEQSVETPETPAAPEAPVAEVPEWDGGLESLDKQPWWASVPDPHKEHLRGQYERHSFYKGLVDADDGVKKAAEEMMGLKQSLGAEVTKYKTEASDWRSKYEKLDGEHRAFRTEVEDERLSRQDAEVKERYPDIYAAFGKTEEEQQNSPLATFARLVAQGHPMDKAARMTRAAHDMATPGAPDAPAPQPRTRDVTPPDAVALANANGLNPSLAQAKPEPLTPEEARRRLQARIEAEEEAAAAAGR